MKTLDRIIAWVVLAFACLHTVAGVVQMSRSLTIEAAWFFSGGLAVIFCVFLNLIRAYRPPDRVIARISVTANFLLLILSVLLVLALRHDLKQNPQAVVLVGLVFVQLVLSARQWSR